MASPPPIIPQDDFGPNDIHEYSLKEDILRLFKKMGYSIFEADVVSFWKKRGNVEINRDLRAGIVTEKVLLLDSAIERSLMRKSYVLYRGLGRVEADKIEEYLPGQVYIPGQFTSTSRSVKIAYEYTRGKGGIIIEAKTKPDAKGIIFGDINYEDEVLLPRRVQFKILDIVHEVDDMSNFITRYICEVE